VSAHREPRIRERRVERLGLEVDLDRTTFVVGNWSAFLAIVAALDRLMGARSTSKTGRPASRSAKRYARCVVARAEQHHLLGATVERGHEVGRR